MDLSTIGVKFGWAVESTAGTKPTAFTWIKRCSKIAEITVTKEKIDVTCFEDETKRYIAEVGDTGGDWTLTFNGIKKGSAIDTVKSWNELLDASQEAAESGLATWGNIYIPGFGSYFVTFEPGEIPILDLALINKLNLQVSNVEYKGFGNAIEPAE